jgi:hypothetical protein
VQALAFEAHSIKGMSGNLMAWGLYRLAESAEAAASAGRPEAVTLARELAAGLEILLQLELSNGPGEEGTPTSGAAG